MDENPETQKAQLNAINKDTLTPLVRSALNSKTVEVINWDYKQLHSSGGEWTAIYRFTGEGRDKNRTISWSLILKTLRFKGRSTDISAWNYYRREVDAYRSGWFDDLPGGLVTPRSFGIIEHQEGTCWLWLEDITDDIGPHWPLELYSVVARHLGRFNGTYLVNQPLPSWPWLSSGWLRAMVTQCAPMMTTLYDSLEQPMVRRYLPGDTSDKYFRIWEDRNLFLDALDHLPQTICHLDAYHRNLFARKTVEGDDQTVAVDWAFTGWGAIGEELVPLVQAGLGFFELDLNQAQELEEIVFEGYLKGLRDAGWCGDPRLVRLGYSTASLRYMYISGVLALILDESLHGFFPQVFGRSVEECCDYWAQVGTFMMNLTDEARELMHILD